MGHKYHRTVLNSKKDVRNTKSFANIQNDKMIQNVLCFNNVKLKAEIFVPSWKLERDFE